MHSILYSIRIEWQHFQRQTYVPSRLAWLFGAHLFWSKSVFDKNMKLTAQLFLVGVSLIVNVVVGEVQLCDSPDDLLQWDRLQFEPDILQPGTYLLSLKSYKFNRKFYCGKCSGMVEGGAGWNSTSSCSRQTGPGSIVWQMVQFLWFAGTNG